MEKQSEKKMTGNTEELRAAVDAAIPPFSGTFTTGHGWLNIWRTGRPPF